MYNEAMDFSNIVIYTDMDGTVLTDWNQGPVVPQRNLAAIQRFMEQGGTFSVASGRQYQDILPYFHPLVPNAPLVQGNGTSLYDCLAQKVACSLPLSREYKEECVRLCLENPWVWAVPGRTDTVMQLLMGDQRDSANRSITGKGVSIEDFLAGEFTKVVYVVADPEQIPRLRQLTESFRTADQMQQTLSSPVFLECYDRQAGKDSGIRRALELAGMQSKTLVCIGDYYNDVPMLRLADIAACPANAPADIRAQCQIVTCNNNDGALADLIDQLERL